MKRQGIALALLLLLMITMLSGCVGASAVTFDNQTQCGAIRVELTNSTNSITETYAVEIGESLTIEVESNVVYTYVVDYTAAENDMGYECLAIHRGQLSVPGGSTQTFNLTAVTPTPPPSE